ncbi:VOC family protein [Candidatus Dojkabacteria bacterium]|uniref:VOC family protein n=1 Tax=Candidatus Dojkabacteria bacterium TaxID=2099670 RepID=A0A955L8F1_9BACT|nr:VOC family protein [Candidatus Dojkabacteria bacterium]
MTNFSKYRILIWSEDPDELMKFYRDVLELKYMKTVDIPNDYGHMFEVNGDMLLWIGYHSEVKGLNKEPWRHMFNLFTNNVQHWFEKIKSANATVIAEPNLAPFATKEDPTYVCTFQDPEGNTWQLMGLLQS